MVEVLFNNTRSPRQKRESLVASQKHPRTRPFLNACLAAGSLWCSSKKGSGELWKGRGTEFVKLFGFPCTLYSFC